MVEDPYIPDFLKNNKKVIPWEVKNPTFVTKEVAEVTYAQIETLVKRLIEMQRQK